MHDLIHINEALSGLPVDVSFINFEDIRQGALENYDVVINAGAAGTAWSGADAWKDEEVIERLTKWTYEGGTFIGVNEPSAVEGYDSFFRMAPVLGVDRDIVDRVCHGQWSFTVDEDKAKSLMPEHSFVAARVKCHLTDGTATVLSAVDNNPVFTQHDFGKGQGIYLSSFEVNNANTRLLLNLILSAKKEKQLYLTDNADVECAYYPQSKTLIVINNSEETQETSIETHQGVKKVTLDAFDILINTLD